MILFMSDTTTFPNYDCNYHGFHILFTLNFRHNQAAIFTNLFSPGPLSVSSTLLHQLRPAGLLNEILVTFASEGRVGPCKAITCEKLICIAHALMSLTVSIKSVPTIGAQLTKFFVIKRIFNEYSLN